MAEKEHQLPNGDTIIEDFDRERNITFNIDDLYQYRLIDTGSAIIEGAGKYVPNEDDLIWGFTMGLFRVARVDKTSYVADLEEWKVPKTASEVGVEDVLLGVGPGYSSETWRAYLDTRVMPYRLDIDSRLHLYGTEALNIRVFRGINITQTGQVISAYYNQSGDFVSDAIPLELVGVEQVPTITQSLVQNRGIKAPVMGYSTIAMADGELVTAVVYNNLNQVVSTAKLLVHNTNVVRHPDDSMKRVRSIELISPYLSKTEAGVIELPINATIATLGLRAKVTYIDGKTSIQDVTDETANGKFALLGLQYFSPTITGREYDMVLTYRLSAGEEYSYLQGETANGRVTQPYRLRVMPVDYAFSLKLFAFPTWISDAEGYGLEYWLYDLKRDIARRVPKAAVTIPVGGRTFDGKDFTSTQYLNFSVKLSTVDVTYGGHVHVQASQIALQRTGGIQSGNWKLKFASNQAEWFGDTYFAKVRATTGGMSTIDLSNGFTGYADWLKAMYTCAEMLYDPQTEVAAPAPTHFVVTTKTRSYEIPVALWQQANTIVNDLSEGATVYLQWIKKTANGTLQLGVTGLPIHKL